MALVGVPGVSGLRGSFRKVLGGAQDLREALASNLLGDCTCLVAKVMVRFSASGYM